jgi:hypothetical protein
LAGFLLLLQRIVGIADGFQRLTFVRVDTGRPETRQDWLRALDIRKQCGNWPRLPTTLPPASAHCAGTTARRERGRCRYRRCYMTPGGGSSSDAGSRHFFDVIYAGGTTWMPVPAFTP